MNLLLDAHAMLWFFWDDPQLSPAARKLIEDPTNRKLVSIATLLGDRHQSGPRQTQAGGT
jgi:PIN domain nuclease of toxin-antitoxin system